MNKLLGSVSIVLLALGAESRAQWGLGGYGYGAYYQPSMYAADTRVPYFALYPPVYYSYPVPRPYGYSPFAYPGWTPTPHVAEMEQPLTIVNRFVPKSPVPADSTEAVPAAPAKPIVRERFGELRPQRIFNPHVGDIVAGGAK